MYELMRNTKDYGPMNKVKYNLCVDFEPSKNDKTNSMQTSRVLTHRTTNCTRTSLTSPI